MNPFKKNTLRTAIAAVVILGLTTSAFAGARIRVVLNCSHEDTLVNLVPNPDPATQAEMPMVPTQMNLEVAGAGWGSHLRGIVVCISRDYSFNLITQTGSATFKLRDSAGDVLVYQAELMLQPSSDGKHYGEFEGTYMIVPDLCTGRFAGATGAGVIWGWADNDAAPKFTMLPDGTPCLKGSGQGYSEMTGSIVLAKTPRCPGWK